MAEILTSSFQFEAVPPFRLDYTVWCLRRHPKNRMDLWDGISFRKVCILDGIPHLLCVQQHGSVTEPYLDVSVMSRHPSTVPEDALYRYCENLLGFNHDLTEFYRRSSQHPVIDRMAQHFLGMKPTRFPTVFECILNGIVCQQISLAVCIQLLNRITERYGKAEESLPSLHAFPRPEDIPRFPGDVLREQGISRRKSATIVNLANRIHSGDLDLEGISGLTDADATQFLQQINGIGPWTARYVLLRGLGRIHIFPTGDVGAQNKLRWLFPPGPEGSNDMSKILTSFQEYGGLLYFHLLLQGLADRGVLETEGKSGLSTG